MNTVYEWLMEAGFDSGTGTIILRWQPSRSFEERERYNWSAQVPEVTEKVRLEHPWLHERFNTGYGGVEAPEFIAEDKDAIYVVGCYDGSSWLNRIEKDLTKYLDPEKTIPCIGGG